MKLFLLMMAAQMDLGMLHKKFKIKKDKKIKGLSFSKNFGHQMALTAGIDYCNSDFLIMMDGILQHPPEYINKMIKEYEKGYDIVQMVKKNQGSRS